MMSLQWQLLDAGRHAQTLENLSLQALADEDLKMAFAYADRRCRIAPAAQIHHYTLRAEISHRMGEHEFAISDLLKALALDPLDVSANRRLLAWGTGPLQSEAARVLISNDGSFAAISKALIALSGKRHPKAYGSVSALDAAIVGWAAWRGEGVVELVIASEDGSMSMPLTADQAHPLQAIFGHAASFDIRRPRSRRCQTIHLLIDGETFCSCSSDPNERDPAALPDRLPTIATKPGDRITVVVPVYGDYAATRRCLRELCRQLTDHQRAIVVDDASPDPRIHELVRALAEDQRVECLFNVENLGFVGSVNRALRLIEGGDVLLLNADTVLPPRLAPRLAAVARSACDIGTVTPLSNNGEFTSFPRANEANPMGTRTHVLAIDRTAAAINADALVDIPNGIGFCLYITRQCLDAVGYLSETLHRGYLEDVDFCLRAREFGFRNVCTPGIYVGHAGSRSFGKQKRSLVVRNLHAIESRYPSYREECASFLLANPIGRCREAIERAAPRRHTRPLRLLISAPGVIESVVATRAGQLAGCGNSVLILQVRPGASGPVARLRDWNGGAPQSIAFEIERPNERKAFIAYVEASSPESIEFVGAAAIPMSLLDLIVELGIAYDVLVADAGIVCRRGTLLRPDGSICAAATTGKVCVDCDQSDTNSGTCPQPSPDDSPRRQRFLFLDKARRIASLSPRSSAFATRLLPDRHIEECAPATPAIQPAVDELMPRGHEIGIVSVGATAAEHRLILNVARLLRRERPAVAVTVVGRTFDDLGLMKVVNVFVSGSVPCEEFARVIRQYKIGTLFLPVRQPLFGHPLMCAAESCGLPLAYFDWSFGSVVSRDRHLALHPSHADDEVARRVVDWFCGE